MPRATAARILASVYAAALALVAPACGERSDDPTQGALVSSADAAKEIWQVDGSAAETSADGGETESAADGATELPGSTCPGGPGCACTSDQECGTGDPCVYGVACEEGACSGGFHDTCDDENPCTTDICSAPGGCSHTVNSSWCSDGNPCTVGDTCAIGACVAGPAKQCSDGNPCTDDACIPGQGCQFANNAVECAPANDCIEASFCTMGYCLQGKGKPCDDGQPCTYDGCNPATGCEFLALPGAATCADGLSEAGRCWKAAKPAAPLTWAAARSWCQGWGGELASARHVYDNARIRKLADAACGQVPAWIGLHDQPQEGKFRWTDGESSQYRQWNQGEPNNSGEEDVTEQVPGGGWNDLPVAAARQCFVCARSLWPASCDDGEPCTAPSLCQGATCLPSAASSDCDDANPCTADGCAVGLGCGHTAVDDGNACGGGLCQGGVCMVEKTPDVPKSCAWIPLGQPNGVYWIDPDGGGPVQPFQAWCDLSEAGTASQSGPSGGWTLVLEVDGSSADAAWAAPLWTEATATAGASLWPSKENARHSGYATVPVTQLRVGMVVGGVTRTLVLAAQGPNLRALLTGKPVATKADLLQWQALLPQGSLQSYCHSQGLAVVAGNGAKVRIGILGNNENDCASVDSWLGLGAAPVVCGQKGAPTAGNVACWNPDHGPANLAATAWVMVR